ncbi:MAG: nitrilase-related carbon-nitrogen hydrolase [Conexivisphaerales archaeon]
MNIGDITSTEETVGVAVVNYPAPIISSMQDVIQNAKKMSAIVEGTKRGIPGIDLIIFPEYSLQGFNPKKWKELSLDVNSKPIDILLQTAIETNTWIVAVLTGEINKIVVKIPMTLQF